MALRATTFLTLNQLKTWCKVTPGETKSVSALTSAGGVATATVTKHGFRHGDSVAIAGAAQAAYNGTHVVTLLDANRFTFPVSGTPASPATGTITALSDQDAVLTIIGDRVSEDLERETGRTFKKRAGVVDVLDGRGGRAVALHRVPVLAVSAVTVAGAALAADQYAVETRVGLVRLKHGRVFPEDVANVQVTYDAGYEDADLPSDAIGTALDIARYLYDRISAGAIVASSISIGGSNLSIVPGLPRDLRNAVDRLRSARMVA